MNDEMVVLFIFGLMVGCGMTLLIQAYGRRKVRKALASLKGEDAPEPRSKRQLRQRDGETEDIARRLAVLEQIVTDQDRPLGLAKEIEGLRREAL